MKEQIIALRNDIIHFLYTKIFEDVLDKDYISGHIILLGIGYKDYRVAYYCDKNKANADEYIKWQTK